jgi:hypothetical protein
MYVLKWDEYLSSDSAAGTGGKISDSKWLIFNKTFPGLC